MSCELCSQECEELEILEIYNDYYESCRVEKFWACPDCVREHGRRCTRKQAELAGRNSKEFAEWDNEEDCDD